MVDLAHRLPILLCQRFKIDRPAFSVETLNIVNAMTMPSYVRQAVPGETSSVHTRKE
jgi:hypothetical protein